MAQRRDSSPSGGKLDFDDHTLRGEKTNSKLIESCYNLLVLVLVGKLHVHMSLKTKTTWCKPTSEGCFGGTSRDGFYCVQKERPGAKMRLYC